MQQQHPFGTCWAMAATAVLEGIMVGGKPLQKLSEQMVISCEPPKNGGQDSDRADGAPACHRADAAMSDAKDGDMSQMVAALAKYGPGSVGVDASCLSGYKGGVITNCSTADVDHA
eukprot:gene26410-26492_t